MATTASRLLGRPVWYELMTTDTAAAETFYKDVVGWTSLPFAQSPNPYTVFKRTGDVQVAGLMPRPAGMNMPPFWSMYVAVPKLEDAVAHIKRLGGSELSGIIDVPTVGRMQMLKDPQGAAFYIIQPASAAKNAAGRQPEVGEALVARADDDRRRGGAEVLQRRLRLAAQRDDGHGRDGQVPHVQSRPRHDRRHDEQAAGNGAGAARTG